MDILESLKSTSENGVDLGKKYVETSLKYSKLKGFQIVTYTLSSATKLLLFGGFLAIGIIFMAIAGAIALGDYLNNPSLGYLYTGLGLLVIALLTLCLRKIIDKKIITTIHHLFFESE